MRIDFRRREAICARQPVAEAHARRCNASTSRICRRASTMEGKPPTFQVSFLSPGEVETGTDGKRTTARKLLNPFQDLLYLITRQENIHLTLILHSRLNDIYLKKKIKIFTSSSFPFLFFKIFEKSILD